MNKDIRAAGIMGIIGLIFILFGAIINLIGVSSWFLTNFIPWIGVCFIGLGIYVWANVKNIKDISKTEELEKRIKLLENKLKSKK